MLKLNALLEEKVVDFAQKKETEKQLSEYLRNIIIIAIYKIEIGSKLDLKS